MINIPGFEIKNLLGRGGMSEVYLARKLDENVDVAIKIVSTALANNPSFKLRFSKEMQVIAELKHKNVIKYYGSGLLDIGMYLVLELLPGPDLKKRIVSSSIKYEDVFKLFEDIGNGINFVHKHHYLHRDIKPENILFRKDGTAVVTDFGIAKSVNSGTKMTGTGMSIGTPYYMSPEQARGQVLDFRTDIYSLGVMLYEVLTGFLPYDGEDSIAIGIKHITAPVPILPKKYEKWQPIINKMMAKNRDERYANLDLFLIDLKKLQSGDSIVSSTTVATKNIQKTSETPIKQSADSLTKTTQNNVKTTKKILVQPPSALRGKSTNIKKPNSNLVKKDKKSGFFKKLVMALILLVSLLSIGWYIPSVKRYMERIYNIYITPAMQDYVINRSSINGLLERYENYYKDGKYFTPEKENSFYILNFGINKYPNSKKFAENLNDFFIKRFIDDINYVNFFMDTYRRLLLEYYNPLLESYYKDFGIFLINNEINHARYASPSDRNAYTISEKLDDVLGDTYFKSYAISRIWERIDYLASIDNNRDLLILISELKGLGLEDEKLDTLIADLLKELKEKETKAEPSGVSLQKNDNIKLKPVESSETSEEKNKEQKKIQSQPKNKQNTSKQEEEKKKAELEQQKKLAQEAEAKKLAEEQKKQQEIQAKQQAQSQVNAGSKEEYKAYIKNLVKDFIFIKGGAYKLGGKIDMNISPFYISNHTVTFEEYDYFAKETGRPLPKDEGWGRGSRPVINVSWNDAKSYIEWLRKISGVKFGLPSEAQWEFAASGGRWQNKYIWGDAYMEGYANCLDCSSNLSEKTTPVRNFKYNFLRLYDMAGNVWQWVEDCYSMDLNSVPKNGRALTTGNCKYRVLKGGSFRDRKENLTFFAREKNATSNKGKSDGFRLILEK